VIDHEALLAGNAEAAVRRVPRDLGPAWYRGWMIPSSRYGDLATTLADRGARLHVTPDRYRTAHELPGWHAKFAEVTPQSVWLPWAPGAVPTVTQVGELISPLGRGSAVVKDYVKSRKHEWAEACFVPELADVEHTSQVIARMIELQDDFLQGGVVVRRFENYHGEGGRAAEARVWWIDSVPVVVGAHPDTPEVVPQPDLTATAPLVAELGCRFVSTDLALRDDGVWRVVEVGDGQVSDLPNGLDPVALFAELGAADDPSNPRVG
jgi:hypothetical protein